MSLLDSFYKKYNIMNQTTVDDPEGGWVSGWTSGATVEMALDDPTQTQKTIAQAQKVQVVQSALFPIGTPVWLNAYLRQLAEDVPEGEREVYVVQSNPVPAPGPSGIQVLKADVMKTRLPK